MTGLLLLAAGCCLTGTWLLLSSLAVFRRSPLRVRLSPYAPARTGDAPITPSGLSIAESLAAVLVPIAETLGSHLSRLSGIRTDLPTRLRRAGSTRSPSEFRLHQFVLALLAAAAACLMALWIRPGGAITVLLVLGIPALVALSEEQRLESAAKHRSERLEAELPVVSEQIAVLLASGLSLGSALERICQRGNGVLAQDLRGVQMAVRQGTSEADALHAWAERVRCEGIDRLVGVLAMHRDAADLGMLLATEARAIRAAAHRRTIESIEQRAQLVWVPVTVATLVPGLILIGVPFVSAMTQITG